MKTYCDSIHGYHWPLLSFTPSTIKEYNDLMGITYSVIWHFLEQVLDRNCSPNGSNLDGKDPVFALNEAEKADYRKN